MLTGRRNCLGEALARIEVYMFIASIVQKYEILPEDPNSLPCASYNCGVTLNPHEYNLILKPRNPK